MNRLGVVLVAVAVMAAGCSSDNGEDLQELKGQITTLEQEIQAMRGEVDDMVTAFELLRGSWGQGTEAAEDCTARIRLDDLARSLGGESINPLQGLGLPPLCEEFIIIR